MDAGSILRKLRLKNGLTLQEVVDMARGQIDKTTLSRVERNERGVSLKTAFLLSQVYGEDFETLARRILQLQGVKSAKK
ncbi:MAG: helix-turn-helix transcriptional regulator [bacterium]